MTEQQDINWTALSQFWELMEDDGEGVDDLVETFLNDAPNQVQKAQNAYSSGDMKAFGQIAHTLKGSSSTMGAVRFAAACRTIEQGVKNSEERDFQADLDEMLASYKILEDLLRNWRDHLEKPDF